jgi:hypothetical protein
VRLILALVFWTLAVIEAAFLLFMLFFAVAAGSSMAENGDLGSALLYNIFLPMIALAGAMLLFALTRSLVPKMIAMLVVLWPLALIFAPPRGIVVTNTLAASVPAVEVEPADNRTWAPAPDKRPDK